MMFGDGHRRIAEAFRGNNNAQIRKVGADRALLYAAGKALPRDLVESLTQQMLLRSYLREEAHDAGAGFMADYVFHGQRCPELRSGHQRLIVKMRGPGVAEGKAAGSSEEKKKKKRRKKEKAGAPAFSFLRRFFFFFSSLEPAALPSATPGPRILTMRRWWPLRSSGQRCPWNT